MSEQPTEKEQTYNLIRSLQKEVAELRKGLEIAQPTLRSAYKQQWDGAYNAFETCSSLLKEQGE